MDYNAAHEMVRPGCGCKFEVVDGALVQTRVLYTSARMRTILYRRPADGAIVMRAAATDVVTWYPDGRIVLDSGGWRTVTTKARMNEYLAGVYVYQERSVWYLQRGRWDSGERYVFEDGITIHPDGHVTGAGTDHDVREQRRLAKQINAYARGFANAVIKGDVPQPSGGDCWHCHLVTVDEGKPLGDVSGSADHLRSHIRDRYYVPSLLANALGEYGSVFVKSAIGAQWQGERQIKGQWGQDIVSDQVAASIRRYMRRRLGITV